MKVLTILGTRPELIRLSRIIPKLDAAVEHVLVHTGQNYDDNLNKIFMDELGIRKPDYYLNAVGSFGVQLGIIIHELEWIIKQEQPDAFLVLGDTNSSLGAIAAKRHSVRVFHMEAGNRCYDDRVPEEVNRRIIDHTSDILLPYTERSRQNLISEGIHPSKIYVTGNPIKEVIDHYGPVSEPDYPEYFLATLHRAENVDNQFRLAQFIEAFNRTVETYNCKLIWPVHPRTAKQLKGLALDDRIILTQPLGFYKFTTLEAYAKCVLTDSGTVQEECAIFQTPVVTLRDSTERPETIEAGSNYISGCNPDNILYGIKLVLNRKEDWTVPPEYIVDDVSDRIINIITGFYK